MMLTLTKVLLVSIYFCIIYIWSAHLVTPSLVSLFVLHGRLKHWSWCAWRGYAPLSIQMSAGTSTAAHLTRLPAPLLLLPYPETESSQSVSGRVSTSRCHHLLPRPPRSPSPPYKAPRLCMSWRSWTVPWRCSAPPGHSPGCGQPLRWGCCPLYTAGTLWCDTARRVGSGCGGTRPGGYRTPLRGCSRCGQPGWACCQNWTRPGVRQTCDVVAAAVGLWRASPRPAYSS